MAETDEQFDQRLERAIVSLLWRRAETASICPSDAAREVLLESFRNFEHDDLGAGTHERMLHLADELAAYYGVPLARERGPAHMAPGRCGHGYACH